MMNTFGSVRKTLTMVAGVAAAVVVMSGSALAGPSLPDFTIDPNAFGFAGNGPTATVCPAGTAGAGLNTCVVADKIIGNYVEVFSVTAPGKFSVDILYTMSAFVANDGTTQLGASNTGLTDSLGYNMYALFSGGGDFSCTLTGCNFSLDPAVGSALQVYEDPLRNTTFTMPANSTAPGTINITRANQGEDNLLATGVASAGTGSFPIPCNIQGGQACGSFTIVIEPVILTSGISAFCALGKCGADFFVRPIPFYIHADLSGQLNSFDTTQTQTINGSADTVLGNAAVPEPASLTLFGLGLLGVARRRFTGRRQ